MRKPETLFVIFLFLLSFAIRLGYLNEVAVSPLFLINLLDGTDMAEYVRWGLSISSGNWLGTEPFWQAPLFPYMLGVIFRFLGENIYLACFVQVAFGALTCVLIYMITKHMFGMKVACVSSLVSCFYGVSIFYTAALLSETTAIFLISIALLSLISSFKMPGRLSFFVSGFLLALSSLARPNFLLLAPFILMALLIEKRGLRKLSLSLLFCAGIALGILPVTLRNYVVSGRLVVISANAFETFRLANSYDSVALNFTYPKLPIMPIHSAVFWKHQFKKAILFWYGYEAPQNVNYYLFAKYCRILRFPLFPFWIIAPLGLAGIAMSIRGARRNMVPLLFCISHYISVVPFYVSSRFRLPIMVGLIPFAGFCMVNLYERLRLQAYKKFSYGFCSFLVLLFLMLPWRVEPIRPQDYRMLANAMVKKGMYKEAAELLSRHPELKK